MTVVFGQGAGAGALNGSLPSAEGYAKGSFPELRVTSL